jgi:hypothetical protein
MPETLKNFEQLSAGPADFYSARLHLDYDAEISNASAYAAGT